MAQMINCPHCGFENYYPRKICVECGKDMLIDRVPFYGASDSQGETRLLSDIADALERTAIAVERIYNLILIMLLFSILVGVGFAVWLLSRLP